MSAPLPLRDLHLQHGGKVSDKWSSYLEVYQDVFAPYREQHVALLEIGVQNGGSLEVWSRYFPHATRLVGCDIDPRCGELRFEDPRIRVVVGDAGKPATEAAIAAIRPDYDIVIDDGSHRSGDIVRAFALYFPRVRMGGVFAAEDLHCSYWQQFEGGLFDPYSAMSFFKRLADLVNHEHWGVPGTRAQVLRPFLERYGCAMEEEVLASIHSVAFVNSVCVVRRESPERNGLGRRLLAGSAAAVSGEPAAVASRASVAPPQDQNPWSQLSPLPEDAASQLGSVREALARAQDELAGQRAELAGVPARVAVAVTEAVASLQQQLQSLQERQRQIEASRSWRLTAPLRAFGRWARATTNPNRP